MTQTNDEQDKLPASDLVSASSSSSALNATALEDPNFPAPIVPLAPGGVLLEPNRADPDGLLVEVTYPSMSVDDTIALIFNGEDTLVPQKGNAELKVTFLVPKEYVAKTVGKTVQVSYSVAGNTGAVRSQTLNLVVHLIPVGQLTAPQIVQAVGGILDVGGLQTAADIFVNAWPLIALKQKTWMQLQGSGNLNLPVWQGYEIGSTGAQVATVQRKDLQNLTDGSQLNLVLEVSFDDGLPRQPFPMRTYQIKNAPEYALGALELVGATGDVIDLGVVSGDPVTVHADAYTGQTAGDRIVLLWEGISADGTPVNYSYEYTVQAGEVVKDVLFSVPRLNLQPLGAGTLKLSYHVFNASGSSQTSPVTEYSVTAATLSLLPPIVVQAPNGVLAPMQALNGANVEISYTDALITDIVALIWNTKVDAVPWQNGASTITFTVPPDEITPVLGKTIEVHYSVRRGQKTWYTSPALTLTVLPLMEGDLETPKVYQEASGVLDLSTFDGDAEIVISPWPFIKEGQTVWLDMDSEAETLPILTAHPVTAPEVVAGVSRPISRKKLDLITDESEINFPAKVRLDGSSSTVGAANFPLLELQLLRGGGSGFEDFEKYPIGEFLITFETDTLIFKGGGGNLHNEIRAWAGGKAISLQTARVLAEMTFKSPLKPSFVSFDIHVIGTSNEVNNICVVTCNSADKPTSVRLPLGTQKNLTSYGKDITHITFKNYTPEGLNGPWLTVVIDNIRWGRSSDT